MRTLWILGAVGVLAFVLGSAVLAAEEGGAKPEHKMGARAGGQGEAARGPRPEPAKLSAEQQAALQPAIDKLKAAITEFQAAVTATLGEQEGRRFMFQTIMQTLRPAGAGDRAGRPEGGARPPRPEGARRGEHVGKAGKAPEGAGKAGGEGDAQGF